MYLISILKFTGTLMVILFLLAHLKDDGYKEYKITGYAQGTTYSITYYSKHKTAEAHQIDSILDKIDSSMSLYKKGSLINQFNASVKGGGLDAHFKKVIVKSLEIYKTSDGFFDITVGPLVQAWGFGAITVDSLPDAASITQLKKHTGSDKLLLRGNYLYKTDKDVKIDVNGIAQGYSVDVLAGFLEGMDISNYLIELGGEIKVKGKKQPDGLPFNLGIESPDNSFEEGHMQLIVQLDDGAITTSGNYKKFYMNGKKKISHLIDPHTGYPLQNEMISATVYAKDALTADGFDNVFMAMGVEGSLKFLKQHRDMEAYFIYQTKNGAVADTASAGFYKFISSKNN